MQTGKGKNGKIKLRANKTEGGRRMGFIKGVSREQQTFWALEDMMDEESIVRVIDRFVDVSDLAAMGFTKTQAAATGRPGYEAGTLAKLFVYGYQNEIRSSRKMEAETKRNIEVMWLMQGITPDHSSISEFRRLNVKALKKLFREFTKLCKSWDLIGCDVIAQDGSKVSASNSYKNYIRAKTVDGRIKRIDEKIEEYLTGMEQSDKIERDSEPPGDVPAAELLKLLKQKEMLETCKEIMEETGAEAVSVTDPDARMMGSPSKGFDIAYNLQIAVDSKHHIILESDVINNPTDRGELSPMIEHLTEEGYITPEHDTAYLADKGYYSGEDFSDVQAFTAEQELKLKVIVPRQDPAHPKNQPETFWNSNFIYDAATDTYTCPAGHILHPLPARKADTKRHSYNNKEACKNCPYKEICISGKEKYRNIRRGEHADTCDDTDRTYEENKGLYKLRRELAEHPFGTVKRYMNGDYFLLRTLPKVKGEAALFFLAYNIKRASNILGFKKIMARLDARIVRALDVIQNICFFIPITRKSLRLSLA